MKMNQLNSIMKQAQKMQADMAKAQEALAGETVEGNAGGGMVRAVFNGQGSIVSIHIEKEVASSDVDMLEDLVTAAVSDGIRKSKELASQRLGAIAGPLAGMGGGGLF